ncbi:hypothetical protein PC9H_010430 [Pleurotus ostreatus]|uniref:Uncharacterized protein n=2 Tax=Pleurotus TaxID=5320 RepID=A0A8H6ZMS7_PLEOS|nr:uncharacterized protein PC9H_010430 [Pleurotus ostreatus]KAF7422274.1 hypothetical protein PC9H_010430 [Pleurotus ostreatus]KAG9227845.1 hypothetical protein CCMSSC00406_0008667 [Pleurotus cornucopiae]KAJ8691921.1 hypothetical protein PTI98_011440 [Pleurotus ostreatus]
MDTNEGSIQNRAPSAGRPESIESILPTRNKGKGRATSSDLERDREREKRLANDYERGNAKHESEASSQRMREWVNDQRSADKRQTMMPSPTLLQGAFTEFLIQMRIRENETGTQLSTEQINDLVRAILADRATRDKHNGDGAAPAGQPARTDNVQELRGPVHPSWDTRVALQRWRNDAMANHEYTEIPDQGIVFDDKGAPMERPAHHNNGVANERLATAAPARPKRVKTAVTVLSDRNLDHTVPDYGGDPTTNRRSSRYNIPATQPYAELPPVGRRARSRNRSLSSRGDDNGDGEPHRRENTQLRMGELNDMDVNRRHRSRLTSEDLDVGRHELPGQSSSYQRAIERRYLTLINDQLGEQLVLPNGLKPPSGIPKPDKYSGEADVEIFNNWLQSLLRWLRLQLYGGAERDGECVAMVGLFIDGKAATWYNDEVDGMYRRHRSWTFARVILDMYDRFVQPTAMQDATEQFYAVEYTSSGGVRGFYDELDRKAARMIHSVDAYTFRRQFLMGLPSYIRNVIIDHGYTAERHRLKEIYRVAIQVEEGRIITKHYAAASSKRAANTNVNGERQQSGNRRFARHTPYNGNEGKSSPHGLRRGDQNTNTRPTPPINNVRNERKDERPGKGPIVNHAARPNAPRQTHPGPSQSRCYACGNLGHFASDPACPKREQPKMFAARDVNDHDDGRSVASLAHDQRSVAEAGGLTSAHVEDDRHDEYERSRYSSPTSDSDGSRDEYENEPEDVGDDRMAAMNEALGERMFAMRNAAPEQRPRRQIAGDRIALWSQDRKYVARPQRTSDEKAVLAMLVDIGGEQAFTLFDSGCTTDSLSPEYARVAKIPYGHLKEPVPLQLGTVGSSSRINFGAEATLKLGPIVSKTYFDIANLDRYDAIIGTPTMRKYGIVLDFADKCVRIGNRTFDAIKEGEETRLMARRHSIQRRK